MLFDLYFSKDTLIELARLCSADNIPAVWTYSSALETQSPRFSQPGDYFTYLLFVASVILVGIPPSFSSLLYFASIHHTFCPSLYVRLASPSSLQKGTSYICPSST